MKFVPELANGQKDYMKIKKCANPTLFNLGKPHLDSFNYMIEEGLEESVRNIPPVHFELPNEDRITLSFETCNIAKPRVPGSVLNVKTREIFPMECRQRSATYRGQCTARLRWSINGTSQPTLNVDLGELPIMVKSKLCNLDQMSPKENIEHGEHEDEWGGYFIIKGNEKLIRMLLMNRRNYPISVQRSTWKNRGPHFSDMGIMLRCVKTDQTATNNVLHFINNGTCKFMFSYNKNLSYVPIVLLMKCLVDCTDAYIFKKLIQGYENDTYYSSCIETMLRQVHEENLHTHEECKRYIGRIFRSRFFGIHEWITDEELCDFLLEQCILIHLDENIDKFNMMVFMVQKLFQCVQNKAKVEGADCVMMQEVLLGGHLYQQVLKDRLTNYLTYLKLQVLKRFNNGSSTSTDIVTVMTNALRSMSKLESNFQTFLATGNLTSKSGLGLMQNTGLVIMAENINRTRYMSHFRAIHRGSFFVEMRTTEARKLLPDAWGFICPVHTPDGSPCGLLNHLTVNCVVSDRPKTDQWNNIPKVLTRLGMVPLNSALEDDIAHTYIVMLEGKIIGHISDMIIKPLVERLRELKCESVEIPEMLEIVLVPKIVSGQYPGLYLFIGAARMMRPVKNLKLNKIEYIGTFEQVYMDISVADEEIYDGITTHSELSKLDFMSNLANTIPMPDLNQSPRNMYQCQMSKQTMGTPCHNYDLQADTKLYRLQTPNAPLFRTTHYDKINLDDFAMGTNAIVAVISYTGYDMEDAMIINKASYERGFAHGSIFKSEFIELKDNSFFVRDPNNKLLDEFLDTDGLPPPGTRLQHNSVYYCYFDKNEAVYNVVYYHGKEECYVDSIRICGDFSPTANKMACLTIRVPRNPTVGDKFASRAGQKGICSQKWPCEDLPWTESGLVPDIIFNPHGFPSRMTIAMMVETMAGKSAAIHGKIYDATPFKFSEDNTAIDHFGKLLQKSGYNYYGTERMYSGIDGREMTADIFFGIVHYQRLRHMVSDKWQVRSTGPVDALTRQPIKGRSRGGGVRLGEMERDALMSHGACFLLQDRLFHGSDKSTALICKRCGSILCPIGRVSKIFGNDGERKREDTPATCRLCLDQADIGDIEIPHILRYLIIQLSSVNINVTLKLNQI